MVTRILRAMTGRGGALLAWGLVLSLGLALALSAHTSRRQQAELTGKLAAAQQSAERDAALWKAQLSACHAAAGGKTPPTGRRVAATGDPADRLLAGAPEGIDVCARMESADQAVLSTLK